jgi:hypothetical protein
MTAIATGYSYEYQNGVRSVVEIFDQLRASFPTLISLVPTGTDCTATKCEWLEDSLSPVATTIASFDTDGDGTGINLTSTAGMRAGAILRFTTVADVSRTELVQITSVDSATDLTVVRDYGSTTGVTLVVGDKVYLTSSPLNEKTTASSQAGQEPDMAYNYTQIFERVADISRTAQAINIYGLGNALDYQVQVKLTEIMREMNAALLHGVRVARSSSAQGTAGGLLSYMASGNIETTGGVISSTILNNMLEAIFDDGGFSNNYAIVCAENQARKISALNTSGSNPMVTKVESDRNLGGYISQFTGDLPVMNGFNAKIVVDPNMLKDQVAIVDLNKVEIAWLASSRLNDVDSTPPGADYFSRRILGEATFRIKNGTKAHAKATGLTV